jgi:hypothetical protein|tara:strand:+ start:1211 stop:1882 length:672 start_codon:yes stop_codon:yes gene_type:complete
MQFTPPSLIGANSTNVTNKAFMDKEDAARAAGPVMQYEYKNHKPKKQLKEIMKVLKPETKTFLKVPYKFKYNIKDRCVVCGTHKVWEAGDNLRPPLPLHKVRKGYPMRGTYCEKHAAIHRQYEMLEQQILAEEHGLSFSAYIPKAPSMPTTLNPLASGPLTSLKATDIASLSSLGWTIKPPASNEESKEEELFRLTVESDAVNSRVKTLLTEGTKVPVVESEQ